MTGTISNPGERRIFTHKRSPRIKNAKKTKVDDIVFDSQLEALRYIELRRLKEAGIIKDFECQPAFELQPAYRKCCGHIWLLNPGSGIKGAKICGNCKSKMLLTKAITYRADFRIVYPDGHEEIEDVKGMETEIFLLKKKLFEYKYPELDLKIIKKVRR